MADDRAPYHHGNLRHALIDASRALTRDGGAAALSLRDVTRRVGVSPNAAYRHFADRDALLAAVAASVHADVADRMRALEPADRSSARDVLVAVGLGYIAFALDEPGWFDVAFGRAEAIPPGASSEAGGSGSVIPPPLALLVDALDGLVIAGELPAERRGGAEWPCWSAVHGFSMLALHGPLRRMPRDRVWTEAERTVRTVVDGILA